MKAPTFENVKVVGMHFRGAGIKGLVENLTPPVVFKLEREPENQYDAMAVKVFYGEHHIGYVERGQAAFLAPQMDDGTSYSCMMVDRVFENKNSYPLCTIAPETE